MTHFSECAVNVRRKVFKVVLSSLSVNTVSIPPVNVVKVTIPPTYQYPNSACEYAIVRKPVFSTSHANISPAPAVATLNSSLPLHVCDVPVAANLLCHVCKVSLSIPFSANVIITSTSHALIKFVIFNPVFKSPVELNRLFSKFFCYITWFDEMRHWRLCKQGLYVKSCCFFETIAQWFKNYKLH